MSYHIPLYAEIDPTLGGIEKTCVHMIMEFGGNPLIPAILPPLLSQGFPLAVTIADEGEISLMHDAVDIMFE